MPPSPLSRDFFDRPADRVARELLGCRLAVKDADGRISRHVIFETEAYLGAHDLACHGSRGMTVRNAVMFGPAGVWYVYLCYGMHWMLNVVTGREGVPVPRCRGTRRAGAADPGARDRQSLRRPPGGPPDRALAGAGGLGAAPAGLPDPPNWDRLCGGMGGEALAIRVRSGNT